jgi:hypothetical protein
VGLVASLLGVLGVSGERASAARLRAPRVGEPLPRVAMRSLSGQSLTFEQLHGRAVWIAFFHSS